MYGDLAERLPPNDTMPYSPDFILHVFRVLKGVPGSTALTGNQEG